MGFTYFQETKILGKLIKNPIFCWFWPSEHCIEQILIL